LYSTIVETKDEELIRDYLKISFEHFARYSISLVNKEHIRRIAEISDYAKLAVKPILIPCEIFAENILIDNIRDPVDIYAALSTFIFLEKQFAELRLTDTVAHYYTYVESLYERFIKYAKNVEDKTLSVIFDIVFDIWLDGRDQILKYTNESIGIYGFTSGITMFYDYEVKSDFEEALEYINSLIEVSYRTITKERKNIEEITEILFEVYKVKLARALLASRYDYKSVLPDIIELQSKSDVVTKNILKERILLAYLISKLLLYKEVEKTIPKLSKGILYKTALALIGGEEEKKEFFKEVEDMRIRGMPITDLQYTLRRLLTRQYLIPVLKTYFYLKGEGVKIS